MINFLELFDSFLSNKINFQIFEQKFIELFLSNDSKYTEEEDDFIEEINYKLSFTSDGEIPVVDRMDGWINAEEFLNWLLEMKQKNIHFWN